MANLRIAELDFDQIKTNLKNYLQAQDEFKDYDFEGSGLSILLDVLAYNTHYNAYMANMVMNEMFLDSAVKRSSAASIAKHLGYTPTSTRGSIANLDVTVTNPTGLPYSLTMAKYTPFTSTIDGTAYTFYTTSAYSALRVGSNYTFQDVLVKEGTLQTYTYAVSDITTDGKYVLPDESIDTTTIQVTVQNSRTDTTVATYTLCTDISEIRDTSKVYFLELNPSNKYEIYFGDGVIGKNLEIGNIVTVRYLTSSGSITNVSSKIAQSFTADGTIGGSGAISIVVNSNSTGGANAESITSIKFNAPKVYAARNRAVTSADYEALILGNYADAEAISVWGGEQNDPPYYGKVLISLKPFSGFVISDTTKSYIASVILKDRKIMAIQPEFVDPEYLYIQMTIGVIYDPNTTTLSSTEIQTLVQNRTQTFFENNLNNFNKTFYASQFTKYLAEADTSILSITPELYIQKRIEPDLNLVNNYSNSNPIKFYNKLHPNSFTSTRFYINLNNVTTLVYMKDTSDASPPDYNGTGTISLYVATTNIKLSDIGTINYGTGVVTLTGLVITGYPDGQTLLQLTAGLQEQAYNISSVRNQVIVLDDSTSQPTAGRQVGVDVIVTASIQ